MARQQRNKKRAAIEPSAMADRVPPHDVAAEAAVLGSMILDPKCIGDVISLLPSADGFFKPAHGLIFTVLTALYDETSQVDLVTLRATLDARGDLESVGGLISLIQLTESVPSAASAVYYAKIVRDRWLARQVIDAGWHMIQNTYDDPNKPIAELLDESETHIFQIARNDTGEFREATITGVLQDAYNALESQDNRSVTGVETGFFELDEMLCGLQPGDLIIAAGRPGMGKTALGMSVAANASIHSKRASIFYSMEMSKRQLAHRFMCMEAGVNTHTLRRNTLSGDEFEKLAKAVGRITDSPMLLDDTPGMSLMQLRAKARRIVSRHDVDLIVVDYLQLMNNPGAESRQTEVAAISRGLKALGRELNVPVLCLSQLNRASESRADHRPRMSDLRESGAIEQDADVILLMHREDYYMQNDENYQPTNIVEIMVEKQRQGPTGKVKLQWNGPTTSLHNLARGLYDQ